MVAAGAGGVRRTGPALTWRHGHHARRRYRFQARRRGGCFTLTAGRLPWKVNAKSYQSATSTTAGTITGVHLHFTDPGFCNLTADGTSATAGNGTVRFRYTNATGRLQVLRTRGNLHIYQVQGCGGVFHDGGTAALSGNYMITPVQTITSP
jgi:hypothetical protein